MSDDFNDHLRLAAAQGNATKSDMRTLEQYIAEGDIDAAIGFVWALQEDDNDDASVRGFR